MINVLHVTYDMRIGGTEMVIKNIIEGNQDESINMSIFCIEEPLGPWGKSMRASGLSITCRARAPGFDLKLIMALRKHILIHKIDIVHCHQYTPWVYGTFAAALTKARVVFTEHGRFYPDSSSWKRKIVNPFLLNFTSRVTAISQATKEALVEYEFVPKSKIEVVYNGISPLSKAHQTTAIKKDFGIKVGTANFMIRVQLFTSKITSQGEQLQRVCHTQIH
ncbi:MAG: glycosyltransferase, partial [Alteromonas macleodii]